MGLIMKTKPHVNVIVVGGGAAGLAAARAAEDRGLSCQLFEAQDRLGGRVRTGMLGDWTAFDEGAQMVNGDMAAVLELAKKAGLRCAPVPRTGESLCVVGDEVLDLNELISADDIYEYLEEQVVRWDSPREILRSVWLKYQWWTSPWESLGEARRGVERMVTPDEAPAGSLTAAVQDMLLCEEDTALALSMLTEGYGADPDEVDAGMVREVFSRYGSERDDLEFHFPDGMGRIIETLADGLRHEPHLKAPVMAITVQGQHVEVALADQQLTADHVIVAVPPPVASRIAFDLENGDELSELLAAFGPGAMIKTVLSYDKAFWRFDGLSGTAVFGDPMGLSVIDGSFDDGSAPRLIAFLGGPEARRWQTLSNDDRRNRLLGHLVRTFGDAAGTPRHVAERHWVDDPWVGGGYNASVRVGRRRDAIAKLADWQGGVSFAGAELDDSFWGYVEGAILSGRRAVDRLVAARKGRAA